jgi:hypothetical protein
MVKKRGMVKKEVNKMIGINDAFDCELVGVALLLLLFLSSIASCSQYNEYNSLFFHRP